VFRAAFDLAAAALFRSAGAADTLALR